MAKAIFGAAELKIKYPSDLWFLHPSPPPTHDTIVEGTVLLSLPSARKVKKLDVELVGGDESRSRRYRQANDCANPLTR